MKENLIEEKIKIYLKEIQNICWFIHAGENSGKYTVAVSFTEAWDDWNDRMMELWSIKTHNIEVVAIDIIGDESIDLIFDRVAQASGPKISDGLLRFQERLEDMGLDSDGCGLEYEVMDFIKRDIAWACIEFVIGKKDFFNEVLQVLSEGRWPCSWDGSYPEGRFVVM
ncbi:hypothetical protein [Clostridium cavendishii]|nr:hypothetical protein [Clostridium cavendishii]